jgi:hypothetical protein
MFSLIHSFNNLMPRIVLDTEDHLVIKSLFLPSGSSWSSGERDRRGRESTVQHCGAPGSFNCLHRGSVIRINKFLKKMMVRKEQKIFSGKRNRVQFRQEAS